MKRDYPDKMVREADGESKGSDTVEQKSARYLRAGVWRRGPLPPCKCDPVGYELLCVDCWKREECWPREPAPSRPTWGVSKPSGWRHGMERLDLRRRHRTPIEPGWETGRELFRGDEDE